MSALDVVDDSTFNNEKHSVSLQAHLPHSLESGLVMSTVCQFV